MAVWWGAAMSVFYFMCSLGYGKLSKKSCLVERNIPPMSMNTHIIWYVLIARITQMLMPLYAAWTFVVIAPYWEERGWERMRYSEQFMEHIEYAFHAFCKVVLRHEAINAWRDLKRKEAREISQIETYFNLLSDVRTIFWTVCYGQLLWKTG